MVLKSKRGSYTIFITIAFASMLIFIFAAIKISGELAVGSTTRHLGHLWGKSILAEFDLQLKDRYGLLGFYGNEIEVEKKLDFYADYTFEGKKYIEYKGSDCKLDGFCLTEQEIFLKQIESIVMSGVKPKAIEKKSDTDCYGRDITSEWVIKGLPSGNEGGGVGIFSLIEKIKSEADLLSVISQAAENIYIFDYFNHLMKDSELGTTYFKNEIEYIICGKLSDTKAKKRVGAYIIAVRNGLNLIYLYSSAEKRNAALALAESISPGPAAFAIQAVILEAWAYLEAVNDLKLLYADKPVPLLKKDSTWALSLDNIASSILGDEGEIKDYRDENDSKQDHIEPDVIEGIEYEDYLKIFVSALTQRLKTLRIMDLIQINMKYLYNDGFLMCDYFSGLRFSLAVNGNEYGFEEKY